MSTDHGLLDADSTRKGIKTIRTLTWIILTLFLSIIVLERLHTRDEAIDRDCAGYAVIAHEMLAGRQLYSDLWERKPPLLYATFAAAQCITGYGPAEIFLLNLAAAAGTMLGIYFAGAGSGCGKTAGVIAAGFWAMICGDMLSQANQPNAEVFVNLCLTWAFAMLASWKSKDHAQYWRAMNLGAVLAAATLYKQHAVIVCVLLLAGHLIARRSRFRASLTEAVLAGSVILLTWMGLFGYFAASGRLDPLVDDLFRQNSYYAGSMLSNLRSIVQPSGLFVPAMLWSIAPVCMISLALPLRFIGLRSARVSGSGARATVLLCGLWLFGAWTMVVIPGTYMPHYFQLLMPPICVASGWTAVELLKLDRIGNRGGFRLLRAAMFVAAVAGVAARQFSEYSLPSKEWASRKFQNAPYFDNDFTFQREVGLRLASLLEPRETFWNFGEDNTLYFAARHSPPSGLLYLDPLIMGGEKDIYWTRLMADLNRTRPDLIVVSWPSLPLIPHKALLFSWMLESYVPASVGDLGNPVYGMYVRKDSKLRARLEKLTPAKVP